MNVASAFVWLMSAGVLGFAALPQREADPLRPERANAVQTRSEVSREREDTSQRRRVRVVLASPYEVHGQASQKQRQQVDMMAVAALPDRKEVPVRVGAPSSQPSKAAPFAQRLRPSAGKPEKRRHAKANPPKRKSINAGSTLSRADAGGRVNPHMTGAAMDQRP